MRPVSSFLLIASACAALVRPARAGELSVTEVKEAQRIYVVKCAKCHKFYEPTEYADAEWSDWMRKMSRKSKLKSAQEELLTRYLETVRHAGKPTDGSIARPKH